MWQALCYASARMARVARAPTSGATVRLATISQRRSFITIDTYPGRTARRAKLATKAKLAAEDKSTEDKSTEDKSAKDKSAKDKSAAPKASGAKTTRRKTTKSKTKATTKATASEAAAENPASGSQTPSPLTERELKRKAREKENKRRLEIIQLKAIALLKEEPVTRGGNLWARHVLEFMSGSSGSRADRMRNALDAYKSLPDEERERLKVRAGKEAVVKAEAYQEWLKSKTPQEIERANSARTRLNRMAVKKSGKTFKLIKDDRIPRRPSGPFAIYLMSRLESPEYQGMRVQGPTQSISKEWNTMTEMEKAPFIARSRAESEKYREEVRSILGREPNSRVLGREPSSRKTLSP